MELYTLISLSLGIFGGTYAAMNAFRSTFESLIKDPSENCEYYIKTISANFPPTGEVAQKAERAHKRIKRCERIWIWANRIPALVFFGLIFVVGFNLVTDWQIVDRRASALFALSTNVPSGGTNAVANLASTIPDFRQLFPWRHAPTIILGQLTVDLLCIITAVGCLWASSGSSRYMKDMIKAAQERVKARISAPEESGPEPKKDKGKK